MAHYAFLDENNIVTDVITGRNEDEVVEGISDWEKYYGDFRGQKCLRTSIHTYGNAHIKGGTPFRKNYAGIGWTYNETLDAFIPPKLQASFILNEETCEWEPPIPMPDEDHFYTWNEEDQTWDIVE